VAFGFARPVVATSVGSLPEIVENGKTGYIVEPGSASGIADAVISFFKDKKADFFAGNIRSIQYRFSWDHLVEGIEELWGKSGVTH